MLAALLLLTTLGGLQRPLRAQPSSFGAADDPREELQRIWWQREHTLDVMGGASLIAAQWRAAGSLAFNYVTRPVTARLSGTFRLGILGEYEPDIDEPYDLLRLVEFARYNAPATSPFYLRVGPINRMRLGYGHLVNFFNSSVAWDDRTVGAETAWRSPLLEVAAFTDNLLLDGVTGVRAALTPLFWAEDPRTRTFRVGFNYVTDLAHPPRDVQSIDAFNVDLSFDALNAGDITLAPFASVAWYTNYGSGIGLGADLESLNFIDLARFRLRFGLFYNGEAFTPGYIGSFYDVNNPAARIVSSEEYFAEDPLQRLEGVALQNARGGNALVTELRLLLFERFELWYYFQRHYGSQALSEYHLRLFLRVPDRLRLDVGMDRGGLRGLLSLLNDLGDQTALVFDTEYRAAGALWVFIRARYSYEWIGRGLEGGDRYLVQRRFEPLTGLRFVF